MVLPPLPMQVQKEEKNTFKKSAANKEDPNALFAGDQLMIRPEIYVRQLQFAWQSLIISMDT